MSDVCIDVIECLSKHLPTDLVGLVELFIPIKYYKKTKTLTINEKFVVTDNEFFRTNFPIVKHIEGYGELVLEGNMSRLFYNSDIQSINVKTDTSKVTSMNSMFYSAKSFNGDLSNWDVSNVTDMKYMFREAKSYNNDLSKWDAFKVNIMRNMFQDVDLFNCDISEWGVYLMLLTGYKIYVS